MAKWNIDPAHTVLEFSVKHMMISRVKGRFEKFEGSLVGDPANLADARIEVTVDASSINTNETDRDNHLRSGDFFDVEKYPNLTFKSTRIRSTRDNRYEVTGDLTIRDVTRTVMFDLTYEGAGKDPWGNERAGFSAETTINRKEYGLNWNTALELGGVLVGDEVKITADVQLVKQED